MKRTKSTSLALLAVLLSPMAAQAELIGHWAFDDGSGTTAIDSEGSADGALSGSVAFVNNGILGGAVDFTGGQILIPYSLLSSVDVADTISVSMWINPRSFGGYKTVFDTSGRHWSLWINGSNDGYNGVGGQSTGVSYSSPWTLDEWQHLAVTYTPSAWKVYRNGEVVSSQGLTGMSFSAPWIIGGNPSGGGSPWDGLIDDIRAYNTVLTPDEVQALASPNQAPTADAGADQAIRVDDTVYLDGSASFDDNTTSVDLEYSWTFSSLPAGSTAILSGANTAAPSFVADLNGAYILQLIVTDEGGLPSDADEVVISSDNLAPTSVAGDDQLVVVGSTVNLDGSDSSDPEMDSLTYAWTITSAPAGSAAVLAGASTNMPSFVSDLAGTYAVSLVVSDFIGPGAPDAVEIAAASAGDYSQLQIVAACDVIAGLGAGQVTTGGNQNALLNHCSQAITAIQKDKLAQATHKLEKALERTDGCFLRGSPDGNGQGRDWITDCTAQIEIYGLLNAALVALTP